MRIDLKRGIFILLVSVNMNNCCLCLLFACFLIQSFSVTLEPVLELSLVDQSDLNLQRSTCLCLLSTGIKDHRPAMSLFYLKCCLFSYHNLYLKHLLLRAVEPSKQCNLLVV